MRRFLAVFAVKMSMAMMDADTVLVDTNILISASVATRPFHDAATEVMNAWPNEGKILCISGQILREYLVVATRPLERNGLGFVLEKALYNVRAFRERMHFLEENLAVAQKLQILIEEVACSGNEIHDANLIATALTHNVGQLVTENYDDLKRFSDHLSILRLSA